MYNFAPIQHHQLHERHLMTLYFLGLVAAASIIVAVIGSVLW